MGRYLVTGAAGFIGSRVADMLLDQGHEVVGIDNFNDAYDVRLKDWRFGQLEGRRGFTFHKIDIADRDRVTKVFREERSFDGVVNLAARAGVRQSVENPWVYNDTNVTGTLNLLEMCRVHSISKFILASTSSLYGKENPMPYREDQPTDRPLSPYAASKKAAEALCYTYHYLHGIDVTVFRYFTVYGPAGRPDMSLFRFVQWISERRPVLVFGDGNQSRDFTYVDDVARGTIAGLKPVGFEIVNLGSDTPVKLIDSIRMVEKELGQDAKLNFQPRHPADVTATWADIDKAKSLLGWEPRYSLERGVGELVHWYNENRKWASQVSTD